MSENWPPTEEPKAEEPDATGQPAEPVAAADPAVTPFPSAPVPPPAPAADAPQAPPQAPEETFSGPPTLGDQYPTHQYPAQPAPPGPPSAPPSQQGPVPPYPPAGPYTAAGAYPGAGHYPPGHYPTAGQYLGGAQVPPAGGWSTPPPPPPWNAGPGGPPSGWGGVPGATAGAWPHPGYPPAPTGTSTHRGRGVIAGVVAAVLAVALLAGAGVGHLVWSNQSASNPDNSAPSGSGSDGSGSTSPFGGGSSSNNGGSTGNSSTGAGAPSDISAIASKVDPGIVDINTNLSYQNEQAAGTGMVLTSDGEILTNNHVIDGATSISATDVGSGKTYTASVVGYDRSRDVAVLKLQGASGLQTVKTTTQTPSVGQAVVGIGNAGGAGGTPSTAGGSVTALNQQITASDSGGANPENLTGLIEVNAPIQPGDSGGPLVNASSLVIGMDTAAAATSGFQVSGNQAYAIPIGTALTIARQIEAGQSSSTVHIGPTAFLGVEVTPSNSSSNGNSSNGLGGLGIGNGNGGSNTTAGASVAGVVSGGAAAQAGLTQGDVITGFNGHTINTSSDLSSLMIGQHPGDTVQLQWSDSSGQTHTASIKLASGPPT